MNIFKEIKEYLTACRLRNSMASRSTGIRWHAAPSMMITIPV